MRGEKGLLSPVETTRLVRGVTLFERRVGDGPPVVVLHGGPGAHHDYLLPGFDRLATGRTLIYYDQRGGGRSPVARDVALGWREQVADLDGLRVAWGFERLAITGYSWGGLLALLYALEHPDRISHLALVSAAPAWRAARAEFEATFAARSAAPAIRAMRAELQASGLREQDPEAYRRRTFELSGTMQGSESSGPLPTGPGPDTQYPFLNKYFGDIIPEISYNRRQDRGNLQFDPKRSYGPPDRQVPCKSRLVGGIEGHNRNEISFPGSPPLIWAWSFI